MKLQKFHLCKGYQGKKMTEQRTFNLFTFLNKKIT